MSQDYFNDMEDEKPVDWKGIIMQNLIYWPMILIFLVSTMVGAWIYLRYQTPVYQVSATVLIKQGDKGKSTGIDAMSAMQNMGMMSMASNFDNELEVIQSRTLIKKVVTDMNLYISYSEPQRFSYDNDLYKTSPMEVWMSAEEADRLPYALTLNMTCLPGGQLEVLTNIPDGSGEYIQKHFDKLPAVYVSPVGTLTFSLPNNENLCVKEEKREIIATIVSPTMKAISCKYKLVGEATNKFTSIVKLDYVDAVPQRGVDFINSLVYNYNNDANEDKNQVATRTAQFIDERIAIINGELGTTESELANFKQQAGLTGVGIDGGSSLVGNTKYEDARAENTNQLRLIAFLKDYIKDPENAFEVIPTNVGLMNMDLSSFIDKYNEMVINRKRMLRTSNPNHPSVQNLNVAINESRKSVLTSIESVEKGLEITRHNLDIEAKKFEHKISKAPLLEKDLVGITRQQEIKSELYMMLLQKREENAITLAATANNGRIIEDPLLSGQVEPKPSQIYMVAFALGLGLPICIIFLINFFHYKIGNRADVESVTTVTVVGDVPRTEIKDGNAVVVRENKNGLMEEVYRSIRTNIQFMFEGDEKVILFTSTTSGEGKTFNAINMAMSFASMGRKTLVIGMDIRKPGLNKVLNISRREKGITQYLSHPEEYDMLELCRPSELSQNLFVLPGGAVPPNPTELVARESLDKAFEILRKEFDYIIVDTAPIGMVTDTQIIARIADVSVYVCRAGYTHKADLQVLNNLQKDKKLPKLCVLINDIDINTRRNGYYYGFGKYGSYGRYGHGKNYGYGYGYGYGQDAADEKKK